MQWGRKTAASAGSHERVQVAARELRARVVDRRDGGLARRRRARGVRGGGAPQRLDGRGLVREREQDGVGVGGERGLEVAAGRDARDAPQPHQASPSSAARCRSPRRAMTPCRWSRAWR